MNLLKTLVSLESTFYEAAQLACKLQGKVKQYNKFHSGWGPADVVTEADLQVQEFLLKALAKTDLVDCHILAEEDTPSVKLFTRRDKYFLNLDPIDGTAIYAKGGKNFGLIVGLHDGKNLLYTFKHFPLLNWTLRIVKNKVQTLGPKRVFDLPGGIKTKILYYRGDPQTAIPEIYKKLSKQGLQFLSAYEINEDLDAPEVYICGQAAGFYAENPNVYDALVALHFAMAQKHKIYSRGARGAFDLTDIKSRDIGLYYPGYYVAINNID